MFKNFFHRFAHLLGWNLVRCDVFGHFPSEERWIGVRCQGCGLVRKIDDNIWFHYELKENKK